MQFASLGSGSKGNATLVESGKTCILIDCGFSTKEIEKRIQQHGRQVGDIHSILVTHEHADHIGGVARLSRKYRIPVMMTSGTWNQCRLKHDITDLHLISSHETFHLDDLEINPFPVPHDAREPVQFVFSDGQFRLGLLTDTGSITPHIQDMLTRVDALILEGNYDHKMLMNGEYPAQLKQRVSGRTGHLSNEQAADLLDSLDCSGLQHIVAAHMSEKNNHPSLVSASFSAALGCHDDWIIQAGQSSGTEWLSLNNQ